MLEAQGSPLVAGQAASARTQRVRLLRAILIGGVRQEVGQEIDVSATLAPELYQRRVAEPVVETAPPAPTHPPKPAPAAPAKTAARRAAKE